MEGSVNYTKEEMEDELKLREVLVHMVERSSFGQPDYRIVEELCDVVKVIMSGVAACKERSLLGLGNGWYVTEVLTSKDCISYQFIREEADP